MEVIWLTEGSPGWAKDRLKGPIRLWWSLLVLSVSAGRDQAPLQEFN